VVVAGEWEFAVTEVTQRAITEVRVTRLAAGRAPEPADTARS
jgi:hypothetical protein